MVRHGLEAATPTGEDAAEPATKRSRAATRDRLLAAAAEVFAEKGLTGASVEDVAQAAGFTKGAVYSNYGSKEELFIAAFDSRNLALLESARSALATVSQADPERYVIEVLELIAPLDRQWYMLNNEYALYMLRNPQVAPAGKTMRDRYRSEITPMLIDAIRGIGRVPAVDPELLVDVVVSVYLTSSGPSPTSLDDPGELKHVLLSLIDALTVPAQA